jgi:hypothetical protein
LGDCKFCGKPAGFLRHAHKACREEDDKRRREAEEERRRHDEAIKAARTQIVSVASEALRSDEAYAALETKLIRIKRPNSLSQEDCKPLLCQAWEKAVDAFLDDGILDTSEEKRLAEFRQHFLLTQDELDREGSIDLGFSWLAIPRRQNPAPIRGWFTWG